MKTRQYTIRGIPVHFDALIRREVKLSHRSLNAVLLEVLERGLGRGPEPIRYNDLDDLAGSWVKDPQFDRAMASMDKVDKAMWK